MVVVVYQHACVLAPSLLFLETSLVVVMVPNDELTAWLMLSVIKVPRRPR